MKKLVRSIVVAALALLGAGLLYLAGCSTADSTRERDCPPWAAAPGEELWIVERPASPPSPRDPFAPTSGTMRTALPGEDTPVPLPLAHTDVKAQVSGYIATTQVLQKFHNPYNEKIEAVYVFPLPHDAAVNEFVMTIGERRIRGIIREREEAQRIYAEARSQGYVASLLVQDRPNIFTQSVANIEPGKAIDVTLTYVNTLAYADGWYEFVFPMVVGPRFNPPGTTDGVGAVPRGAHGLSGQATEVQYLKPGERSGHDISLAVAIDAGVAMEELTSINHAIAKESQAPERAVVTLSPLDAIPDKDFVLRYRVAGATLKASLLTHRDKRGGFFTLMLFPPADLGAIPPSPLELVFVLDCSGSMQGAPLAKAKTAIERALALLGPGDTFQIVRFSSSASQLGNAPMPATPDNVERGLAYLRSLKSEGGTMMIEGIRAALDFPHDAERLRVVSFMTDGYIGNEAEIFREVDRRLGASRIFSFGVGASTNRYLLEGLARLGKGAVAYVGLDERAGRAVDLFYERIRRPAFTDISIQADSMEIADLFPRRLPDLFADRPVVVTGRFTGNGNAAVKVRGTRAGKAEEIVLAADLEHTGALHPGIPSIWARAHIAALSDFSTEGDVPGLAKEITQLALQFNLVSAYTSFVAVDASARTAGDHGTTVHVAVPVPNGVRYETTVPGGAGAQGEGEGR